MKGRLENQLKAEKKIENLLSDMPRVVSDYYLNFSASKEFRSCLSYVQKLKKFLLWYAAENKIELKGIDCSIIDDYDIALYMREIETKQTSDGIVEYTSFSYRRQIWSILNSFFIFMKKKGLRKDNPVEMIDYPTKKDNVKHVHLQREDLDKIVGAVLNGAGTKQMINYQEPWKKRDLAIVYTFIFTGMRESALCEIDMDSLDFDKNEITVIDKEHKTNKYPMPGKLKGYLKDWIEQREILLGGTKCDALFISNQRKRVNQGTVIALINKYSEEGLGYKVSPHRLRAAAINIIYNETGDINFASKFAKHENISTTRIYIEDDEHKTNKKIQNIMENIF